jgi:NAD(P)-dependent dehydrogenase (short-subunit alcohol dehydrogenase family)
MDIAGKVVVVTGGGNGIGAGLARRFTDEGAAHVAVLDLDATRAAAVADEIGGWSRGVDVTRADLLAAIDAIETELGPIDLFCSNAGILCVGGVELPNDEWQRMFDVNVFAHINAARILVPRMILRRRPCSTPPPDRPAHRSDRRTRSPSTPPWRWPSGSPSPGDRASKVSVLCPQAVNTAMTAGVENGGVAGVDGMLEPADIAEAVVVGLAAEQFLILPHPEVAEYVRRKANDHDRWLTGMRRLQARFTPAP